MNSRKRMSKLMPFHCICLLIDEDFAILRFSVNYGSPKGTSVLTLNQSLFFSKIGVFFFENRSLFSFRKSEFVFFENRSLFFENRSLFFWQSEFVFFENRSLFFGKSGFEFWKSEFVSFENRSLFFSKSELAPGSALSFCSWVRAKSVADPGGEPGGPAPRLFLDQTEARRAEKRLFGDRSPPYLWVWMTAPPPPPYLRVFIQVYFKSLKLRIPAC